MQESSYFIGILRDCRDLISSFSYFHSSFVPRSSNSIADRLDNDTSHFPNSNWVEDILSLV